MRSSIERRCRSSCIRQTCWTRSATTRRKPHVGSDFWFVVMVAAWCLGWLQMKTKLHLAGWLVMIIFVPTALSQAQAPSKRFTIWDIHLGDAASAIPDEYVNYACGTNGGPPSR